MDCPTKIRTRCKKANKDIQTLKSIPKPDNYLDDIYSLNSTHLPLLYHIKEKYNNKKLFFHKTTSIISSCIHCQILNKDDVYNKSDHELNLEQYLLIM